MGVPAQASALRQAFSRGVGGSVASLVGMLLTTVAVLALAYWVTRWVAQRGTSGLPGPAGQDLKVLWQVSLGKAERLVLVRLDQRCLLLGVTSGGISLLAELTEEELSAPSSDGVPPEPPDFRALLRNFRAKK